MARLSHFSPECTEKDDLSFVSPGSPEVGQLIWTTMLELVKSSR